MKIWPRIEFKNVPTPRGDGTLISDDGIPLLFDFFSNSMAAAASGYQAIEAFANENIARHVKGTMTLQRRSGPEALNADEIERRVSTEEKIGTVLPQVFGVPSIKGGSDWQNFLLLKDARDGATHFKSGDQYPLAGTVGKNSLYSILLHNEPVLFPLIAVRVIWHLQKQNATPRWLKHLAEKYAVR
jgi:hypothetical protein